MVWSFLSLYAELLFRLTKPIANLLTYVQMISGEFFKLTKELISPFQNLDSAKLSIEDSRTSFDQIKRSTVCISQEVKIELEKLRRLAMDRKMNIQIDVHGPPNSSSCYRKSSAFCHSGLCRPSLFANNPFLYNCTASYQYRSGFYNFIFCILFHGFISKRKHYHLAVAWSQNGTVSLCSSLPHLWLLQSSFPHFRSLSFAALFHLHRIVPVTNTALPPYHKALLRILKLSSVACQLYHSRAPFPFCSTRHLCSRTQHTFALTRAIAAHLVFQPRWLVSCGTSAHKSITGRRIKKNWVSRKQQQKGLSQYRKSR